jgi:hypothetical protein
VARGNGRCAASLLRGALPGAGADESVPARAEGRDAGDTATFVGDFDGTLRDGTLRVLTAEGRQALPEA